MGVAKTILKRDKMFSDKKLFNIALAVTLVPLIFIIVAAIYHKDDNFFRYPCQDPDNWDKSICKPPICDVTRTCPEHIFKNQRDPRLGPPKESDTAPFTDLRPSFERGCK